MLHFLALSLFWGRYSFFATVAFFVCAFFAVKNEKKFGDDATVCVTLPF
jgi:hypothetical protein